MAMTPKEKLVLNCAYKMQEAAIKVIWDLTHKNPTIDKSAKSLIDTIIRFEKAKEKRKQK